MPTKVQKETKDKDKDKGKDKHIDPSKVELTVDELYEGDILLEHVGMHAISLGIAFFEALSHPFNKGSAGITHAAIWVGFGRVCEAVGTGLQCKALVTGAKYEVYRYKDSVISKNAAVQALQYVVNFTNHSDSETFGKYATGNAMSCLFRLSERGPKAKVAEQMTKYEPYRPTGPDGTFYCSGFVTLCYVRAKLLDNPSADSMPIDADYRWISPKELQTRLESSGQEWEHKGFVRGS